MKKQIKKTKIIKQKKKQQKCPNNNIYLEVILLAIIAPILTLVLVYVFKADKIQKEPNSKESKDVKILTDKNIYNLNDEIVLIVRNNSGKSIYFEPCEYINIFEKKINGEWKKESVVINNDSSYYNQDSFNKNKSITKCEVKLPKSGEGIYRSVVQIYYNCVKPGRCESSEVFYSNEFEVKKSAKQCGCGK